MKKILLFAFACIFAAVACTKNGGGEAPAPVPAPQVEFKKEATAGSKISIMSSELDKDAKFSLVGAVNSELKANPTPVGASVVLPFTLGKFTLCLDQNGNHFELGEINIKVNAPGAATEGNQNSNIVVLGEGFGPDAQLALINDKGSEMALETTPGEGSLAAKLPGAPGVYKLIVKQAGTQQVLVEKFTITDKPLTKVISKIVRNESGNEKAVYAFEYASGKPAKFVVKTQTINTSFNVKIEGETYTFTDVAAENKEKEFSFTLENGRVKSSTVGTSTHNWEYDAKGHCTKMATTAACVVNWDGNNIQNDPSLGTFLYDGAQYTSKTPQDIAMFQMINANFETTVPNDYVLYAAALGGWTGVKSANLPTGSRVFIKTIEYTWTADAKDFVTELNYKNMMQIPFQFKYVYEEI